MQKNRQHHFGHVWASCFFCVHPINQKIERLFRALSNEYATPFCVLMINNNKKLEDDLVYFPTKFGYNYQV
jgi:hypothetical protein